MTSFLEIIAADESDQRLAARKALVTAKTRVDNLYGSFFAYYDYDTALDYLKDELRDHVAAACEEYGHEDVDGIYASVLSSYAPVASESHTASVHESRQPKMCPFHKEVVDISLNAGDPSKGSEVMNAHWGGPRHCKGDGYEGSKCNFKPQMTTQAFWDDRATQAEERKNQRVEQDNIEVFPLEDLESDSPTEDFDTQGELAEVIDFPSEPSAVGEGISEEPMAIAAKVADAENVIDGGGPVPKMDKSRWSPTNPGEPEYSDTDSRWPTRHKDIVEPIKATNDSKFTEIGENHTETVSLPSSDNAGFSDGGVTGESMKWPKTKQADPVTSALVHDVDVNPITDLIQNDYSGFLPESVVQAAIEERKKHQHDHENHDADCSCPACSSGSAE